MSRAGYLSAIPAVALLLAACAGESGQDEPVKEAPAGRNRLAHETSPYLLQHADNPVDWYPWGEEAFAAAKAADKPILVSIGYSACHWCHVMAHECFEDEEIAAQMNELFICIKVDREERPDVDEIYMSAVRLMGEGGGWPLNVFLTPDGVPFFGGTYFPPTAGRGRPSWPDVLTHLSRAWSEQREQIVAQGAQVLEALGRNSSFAPNGELPGKELLGQAAADMATRFDEKNAGFGGAPKFPPHQLLGYLLRHHARTGDPEALRMVERTLVAMAEGGMYDQLGGGFHRYSVDEKWLVPHFEKMLYDNAQLARAYVEAFQVTGNPFYERIARETLDYVLAEMTEPGGGFRSATDADSDGREGTYFIWRAAEVDELLGKDAELFRRAYGVAERGNFFDSHHPEDRGMNVLHVAVSREQLAEETGRPLDEIDEVLARGRARLLEERKGRVYPGLDDKVLTSWNALMIGTMAYCGRALGEPRYVEAADRAADFVLTEMRRPDGELLRTWRGGEAKIDAFLEDYGFLVNALLDLYEATFELRRFEAAVDIAERMNSRFWDASSGAWYHTAHDGEQLVTRTKSPFDGSIPSGNGHAAVACARLAAFTGESGWSGRVEQAVRSFGPAMRRAPGGTMGLYAAMDALLHEDGEIAFVGKRGATGTRELLEPVHRAFLPGTVLALLDPAERAEAEAAIPMRRGTVLVDGSEAVYVCRNFACRAPVTTVEGVRKELAAR